MRVLGLDISSSAVACVEMDTAFGRFEIRDMHESVLDSTLSESSHQAALQAAHVLMGALQHKVDRIITSVPIEISTFRNLQIASKEKRAVRAALEFELEDDLPFERENLHYDSSLLNLGPGGSFVHVCAVKKESFEQHLKQLNEHQIDPDVITSDAWAYRSLLTRLLPKTGITEPVLLFGFEQNKVFFYIHDQNRPVLYREIPFGIKSIEHFLEDKLGASPDEIKNWLNDVGVSGIDEQVSGAISDALDSILPELKQTELSARGSLKSAIDQIYVTGEGALMPGFLNWLEEATGKRVALFKPLSQLSPAQVNYSDVTEVRYSKAVALAMSAISIDKLHSINLRKGEFIKSSVASASGFDMVLKPLPYIAITLVVFLAAKTIEYQYFKGKLTDTDEVLKKATKIYFNAGSDNAIRSYLSDISKLKKTIQADLTKEREMSKLFTPNANSPFDYLKSLSQKIGKDVVLDLVEFDAGADVNEPYKESKTIKTSLTVLVSNAQMLARLNDVLDKNFGLKKGNSEEITQDGRKLLKVIFSGTVGSTKR